MGVMAIFQILASDAHTLNSLIPSNFTIRYFLRTLKIKIIDICHHLSILDNLTCRNVLNVAITIALAGFC